ncbi:MAG: DUF3226 domain-containing protein [Spirulina sp.]
MAKKRKKHEPKPQQLLVEGKNDLHVIAALCQRYNIPENFSIERPSEEETEGIEALLLGLTARLKNPDIKTLGIVADADRDLPSRWQSIGDRLRRVGYQNIPDTLPIEGWINYEEELPKIGIWLIPDNRSPGMLEDFARSLIPNKDPLLLKTEKILQEIERENLNCYSLTHRPKAFIHTWLAWQETPGMPMGQAITARVLGKSSAIAPQFQTWLTHLFRISID